MSVSAESCDLSLTKARQELLKVTLSTASSASQLGLKEGPSSKDLIPPVASLFVAALVADNCDRNQWLREASLDGLLSE